MTYHFIINGFSENYENQIEEMNGFKISQLKNMEEGEHIIVCNPNKTLHINSTLTNNNIYIYSEEDIVDNFINELCDNINNTDLYILGNGAMENELAVRIAYRKKGTSMTNVRNIEVDTKGIIVEKIVYSNHLNGKFLMKKSPFCISMEKGIKKIKCDCVQTKPIKEVWCQYKNNSFVDRKIYYEDKKNNLENANIVIVVGRGLENKEDLNRIEKIAKKINGELGVTRPIAMNAWTEMQKLIGISGKIISPNICITIGVSGSKAFIAGIEKSEVIITINHNENASIIKQSDVIVVEDYKPIIEHLEKLVDIM